MGGWVDASFFSRLCFESFIHPPTHPPTPKQSTYSDSTSKKNGFSVVTSGKGLQLNADTPEEKQAWKVVITKAIHDAHLPARTKSGSLGDRTDSGGDGGGGGGRGGRGEARGGQVGRHKKDTKTFYVVGTEFVLDVRCVCPHPPSHPPYPFIHLYPCIHPPTHPPTSPKNTGTNSSSPLATGLMA